MNKDAVWALFEKTGNIRAYMLYHDLNATNAVDNREAPLVHADENRRIDHTGYEYR